MTAAPSLPESLSARLIGMWRLESRIDLDAAGRRRIDPVLGADPLGVLCFSGDNFAAQFMRRDRSQAPAALPAGSGANNSSAVNGYDAYFGTYTVDEAAGTMRTTLTIRLATKAVDGTPVTRTLTFARIS